MKNLAGEFSYAIGEMEEQLTRLDAGRNEFMDALSCARQSWNEVESHLHAIERLGVLGVLNDLRTATGLAKLAYPEKSTRQWQVPGAEAACEMSSGLHREIDAQLEEAAKGIPHVAKVGV